MHLAVLTPILILWCLWEARNNSKHRGIKGSAAGLIERITKLIKNIGKAGMLTPAHWKGLEKLQAHFDLPPADPLQKIPKAISFKPPSHGNYKLNIDGGSRGNPGNSAGGGIIRDSNGAWIGCFRKFYGNQTSIVAECRALLDGLSFCIRNNIRCSEIDSDSQVLISMIRREAGPWYLKDFLEQIAKLLKACKASISHTYRENNRVAEKLEYINGIDDIPGSVAALIGMDKQGVLSYRF